MDKYVEPKGYLSPEMKKILNAGKSSYTVKKPATKSTTKTTKK